MINTIILDIEGTITNSSGSLCKGFGNLQNKLQNLETNKVTIIFCSGRDLGYIQRFKATLGLTENSPIIAEDGCVVFEGGKEYITFDNSIYNPGEIRRTLVNENILNLAEFDPAKQYMLTMYPLGFSAGREYTVTQLNEIFDVVKRTLIDFNVSLTHSSCSVDVLPQGVDKLFGLNRLKHRLLTLDLAQCMYIGDSKNDLEIGKFVRASGGLFCVPQNASAELGTAANYCAIREFDEGVLEIFDKYKI